MKPDQFDYVIVGAGLGGLFTGALLVHAGYRVAIVDRHYAAGGYGHSFRRGQYTFCAQLHYLWNCSPGDDFDVFLRHLGLSDAIRFCQLDADGFDRLRFPSFRYNICRGFDRNTAQLAERFPEHRQAISRYFEIITRINRELLQLPLGFGPSPFVLTPWRFPNVIRYRNWTTDDLLKSLGLPIELRSILAGQSGDLLLPPGQASLLVQSALACGYDSGPCVPTKSYEHLFDTLVDFISDHPGSAVLLKTWVKSIETQGRRVAAVHAAKHRALRADRFIFNGDPKRLASLVEAPFPRWFRKKLDYEYSASNFTLYLGVRGLDLSEFGFGNWNVWHYPHDDVNACYRDQLEHDRLENPLLFISTPTLHHKQANIAPAGCEQMVVCTACRYSYFDSFVRRGRAAYLAEKDRVTNLMLDQLERHYVPGLRQHLDLMVAGTPKTNERFVHAPHGNAYGLSLTPRQFNVGKIDYRTPFENMWLAGAAASVPSFAGGIHYAMLLYERLTGQHIPRDVDHLPHVSNRKLATRQSHADASTPVHSAITD